MILAVLLTCAFYIVVEYCLIFLYTILLFMGLFCKYVALAVSMFYGWDCEFYTYLVFARFILLELYIDKPSVCAFRCFYHESCTCDFE